MESEREQMRGERWESGGVRQTAVHAMQRGVFTGGPFHTQKKHVSVGAAIWLPAGRCDGGNTLDLIWFVLLVFGDSAIMRDGGGAGHQARPLPLSRSSFFSTLSSYLFGCAASRLAVLSRALFHCSPVVKLSFYCLR